MLKLTNPRLRRFDIVVNSFGGCITNAAKKFSRAPKMPFSKVVSQPRMFFEKFKGAVSFKQLKSHANTHHRGHLNKQVDMINSNMKFINFEPFSISHLPQEKLTIYPESIKLEGIFGIFNFPHKVECVLSEAMLPRFQIHFSSPETLIRNKVHTMFNVYFKEPSISAPHINISTELNLLEDGDSSLL